MNFAEDMQNILRLSAAQRGVFSVSDLKTLTAERHDSAFQRRIDALLAAGVLRRFARGWYVTPSFDAPTLSQRIAPGSVVSFGTVLADELLIGAFPRNQITATWARKTRSRQGLGLQLLHLQIAEPLNFGFEVKDGLRYATPEKAVLDVLYFHQRGRKYVFDIYSDIDYSRLDSRRLQAYLLNYQNPKFVRFATDLLGVAQ